MYQENAYVFYITSNSYACSALINIHRLRTDFATTRRILALVSPGLSPEYISALEETNTTVIIREPPPIHSQSAVYYTNCLLKLLSFQIYEMEPSIERVLTLDADQLIMKNLDHVFDLPETDLAAPRAYWLSDNTAISSTLLLILPDERSWARVKQTIDNIEHNIYDMDIVNGLFNETAILLPGSYATLNSHWEDWTVPNWYRSTMISAGDMSNLESGPVSTNDQNEVMYLESKHGEQREIGVAEDVMSEKLFDLHEQVYVLHYTAVGKPWSYDMKHLRSQHPRLHPAFLEQWKTWRTAAMVICPKGVIDHV